MRFAKKSPPVNNLPKARDIYRPALDDVFNCQKTAKEVMAAVAGPVREAVAGR